MTDDGRSTEESVALTIRSPEVFSSMHHEDRIYNSDEASESTILSRARTYFVSAGIKKGSSLGLGLGNVAGPMLFLRRCESKGTNVR